MEIILILCLYLVMICQMIMNEIYLLMLLKKNLDSADRFESIISVRNRKDKKNYISIEKEMSFCE